MPATRRPSPLIRRLHSEQGVHSQSAILVELRRVILEGGVPPGTAIPVDQVAETFGVSRIPVRESLRTLIGEGLVDHRPHAGYLVAQLTVEEFQGLYTVRGVLEKAALAAAVGQATELDDQIATEALAALDQSMRDNDFRGYHVASRRFHLALVTPSRMRPLLSMLESAWNVTEPFQPMSLIDDEQRRLLHAEHREMLGHFLARDCDALLAVAGRHLDHLDTSIAGLPVDTGLFSPSPDEPGNGRPQELRPPALRPPALRPPALRPQELRPPALRQPARGGCDVGIGSPAGGQHRADPAAGAKGAIGLGEFNHGDIALASTVLGSCLDIPWWVDRVAAGRPFADVDALRAAGQAAAELITWEQVAGALARHPRIGERTAAVTGTGAEAAWSASEQSGVGADQVAELAAGNLTYERRFGHLYLVCAAGLSGAQILADLRGRLTNDPVGERPVVMRELRKIAALRLAKAVTA